MSVHYAIETEKCQEEEMMPFVGLGGEKGVRITASYFKVSLLNVQGRDGMTRLFGI